MGGNYEMNKGTKYISETERSVVERPTEGGGCVSEFVYFIISIY